MSNLTLSVKPFSALTPLALYAMMRLRIAVFVVEQTCPYQDLDDKDFDALHVTLSDDDGVQAYARVLDTGVSFADAPAIGRVISAKRGVGLGAQIMQASLAVAKTHYNAKQVKLDAQVYAQGFYEKLGFVVCSDVFLEDGIPHVTMVCQTKENEREPI